MSHEVVLDIETQNSFADVGGYQNTTKLRISVVGVYYYETDEYIAYEEHELPALWKRLEKASRIIGYNSRNFDLPIMNTYYPGDLLSFPQLDLLEEIRNTLGFRLKLDDVAAATIGVRKSGHGLQAIEWWKQGEIDKIKAYCLDDVKVTKNVYEYGIRHGALAYVDGFGTRKAIPVNFKPIEEAKPKINFSLGF